MAGQSQLHPAVNPWPAAIAVMSSAMMELLDTSVVNVSLPHIAGSLASTVNEATWVLSSYLVANAIVLPITGWLSSYFGRKRLLMIVVSGFTLSSLLCGLAPSLPLLILFRILQGATGGGLQPLSQAVLLEGFPPERRGTAMAAWGMGIVVMPILGPIVGGWITDSFSWRWVFFINLPIGILSLVLINAFIVDPAYLRRVTARIDFWGLGLLALWVGALQIMLDTGQQHDWFGSDFIVVLAVLTAVGLVAFVLRELWAKDPIVHLRLLFYRTFATGISLIALLGFVLYGSLVALPLFLQILLGHTALTAGMLTSPRGIGTMFFMPLAGYLLGRRFDSRWMMAMGFAIAGVGTLAFARMTLQVSDSFVIWAGVVQGCGMGFLFVPLSTTSMDPIPVSEMGYATSIYSFTRNIGSSIGIAFSTTLIARRSQFHLATFSQHITSASQQVLGFLQHAENLLVQRGIHPADAHQMAIGLLQGTVQRQALYASYVDVFRVFGLAFFAGIPFLYLMRKPRTGGKPGAAVG